MSNLSFNQFFNLRGNAKARHPRHICTRQGRRPDAKSPPLGGATPPAGSSGPSGLRPRFARPTRQPPRGFAPRPCGLTPSMVHQSALRARPHCHHHCEHHHQRFSTVQIPLSRRGCGFFKGRIAIRKAWYCAWNRQGALFETRVVWRPAN